MKYIKTDPSDSLNLTLFSPISLIGNNYISSYLYEKDSNYGYITYYPKGTKMRYLSYVVDRKGHVLKDTFVDKPFELFIQYVKTRKIEDNKFLNITRTTVQNQYNRKDTFKLLLNIYNDNLEDIFFKDITDIVQPAYKHELEYTDETHFILKNTDYIVIDSQYVGERLFSLFDLNGNLIEEVSLLKDDGTPRLGIFASAIKLKYEEGMLIFTSDKSEDGFWTLFVLKSDGNGNLNKIKEIRVRPDNHELAPAEIYQLENGDILFNGMDYNHNFKYGLATFFAKFYMYIPAKDLGINTSSSEMMLSKTNNVLLYPNPTKDMINISSFKENFNKIILFDLLGRKVYQEKFNIGNKNSINLDFLNTGIYIVKVYLNKFELGTKKLVIE